MAKELDGKLTLEQAKKSIKDGVPVIISWFEGNDGLSFVTDPSKLDHIVERQVNIYPDNEENKKKF